ncbi:hypothetical protein [Streptococcus agalactiae]|uniref:hypothetical protein n=1 Tax=Streptococcus agalactiae TaxID=1311 RepID=UPI00085C9712|nr:hypothetical protein [Streptococcus agalactiae]
MNWKHAYLRKATEEEIEVLGCEDIWDGDVPDIYVTILIYQNGNYDIDYMDDVDVGFALSNNDYDDFYWCELEKPDTGNGDRG